MFLIRVTAQKLSLLTPKKELEKKLISQIFKISCLDENFSNEILDSRFIRSDGDLIIKDFFFLKHEQVTNFGDDNVQVGGVLQMDLLEHFQKLLHY